MSLCLCRLQRRGRGLPAAGDRRPGSAAADRGPPDDQHEHQTRPGSQDLRSHQLSEKPVRRRHKDREKTKTETKSPGNREVEEDGGESLRGCGKQKLTPRMTEQSHKKRFVVIYEIINRGVALGDGSRGGLQKQEETRAEEMSSVSGPSDCSRRPGEIFVTLCTFYMPLESVNLKLFHEGF